MGEVKGNEGGALSSHIAANTTTITTSVTATLPLSPHRRATVLTKIPVVDAVRPRLNRVRESKRKVTKSDDDAGADMRGSFLLQHCEQQRQEGLAY